MSTLFLLALLCYLYLVLAWGLINFIVRHEGTSLPVLFGVPAVLTLVIWFIGGPTLLQVIVYYPIRLLAQIRYGLG